MTLVLLSSLSYAVYIVGVNRSALAALPTVKLTFYALLFGLVIYVVRLDFLTGLQAVPSWYLWGNVLALAAFTGCSGLLNFATVQVNTEEAQALMKQVSPALQYDTQLEYAAERIAQWMTEEVPT